MSDVTFTRELHKLLQLDQNDPNLLKSACRMVGACDAMAFVQPMLVCLNVSISLGNIFHPPPTASKTKKRGPLKKNSKGRLVAHTCHEGENCATYFLAAWAPVPVCADRRKSLNDPFPLTYRWLPELEVSLHLRSGYSLTTLEEMSPMATHFYMLSESAGRYYPLRCMSLTTSRQ